MNIFFKGLNIKYWDWIVFISGFYFFHSPVQAAPMQFKVPCWDDARNQAANVPQGQTICKSQLPSCGTIHFNAIENARKTLAYIIGGQYLGMAIDINLSTQQNPVGENIAGVTCSVVGHNIAQFRSATGDPTQPSHPSEVKEQKILQKNNCGYEPDIFSKKDDEGKIEINFTSKSWNFVNSYIRGTKEWALKRVAYEHFSEMGRSGGGSIYQPNLQEAAWKSAQLSEPGTIHVDDTCYSPEQNTAQQELQTAYSTLNQQILTGQTEVCESGYNSPLVDCTAPTTNPSAAAFCEMRLVGKLLFESRLEQILICQILKDAEDLSSNTVGTLLMNSADVGSIDVNQVHSKVLKERIYAPQSSLREKAPKYMESLKNQLLDRLWVIKTLANTFPLPPADAKHLAALAVMPSLVADKVYVSGPNHNSASFGQSRLISLQSGLGDAHSQNTYAFGNDNNSCNLALYPWRCLDYIFCKLSPKCTGLLNLNGGQRKNIVAIPLTAKLSTTDFNAHPGAFNAGDMALHFGTMSAWAAAAATAAAGFMLLSIAAGFFMDFISATWFGILAVHWTAAAVMCAVLSPPVLQPKIHPPDTRIKLRGIPSVFERLIVEEICQTDLNSGTNKCDPAGIDVEGSTAQWLGTGG